MVPSASTRATRWPVPMSRALRVLSSAAVSYGPVTAGPPGAPPGGAVPARFASPGWDLHASCKVEPLLRHAGSWPEDSPRRRLLSADPVPVCSPRNRLGPFTTAGFFALFCFGPPGGAAVPGAAPAWVHQAGRRALAVGLAREVPSG